MCYMFEMNFVQVLQNFESKTKSSGFFQHCLENCSGQYASEILNLFFSLPPKPPPSPKVVLTLMQDGSTYLILACLIQKFNWLHATSTNLPNFQNKIAVNEPLLNRYKNP